jgi:cell wall-associated NlpC family hydrolase
MISTTYAQTTHKKVHHARAKKSAASAKTHHKGTTAHRKGTATHKKTTTHHKSTAGHRAPQKKGVPETSLLQPQLGSKAYDSLCGPADTAQGAIDLILGVLTNELGKPYRLGSVGPTSFDCSGLINYAFSFVGVSLPRTSSDIGQLGKKILAKDLRPGDLLFFSGSRTPRRRGRQIGHLGCVYKVDSGKVYMIHSSREGVNITNVSESEYYKKRLIYAKRVLATDSTQKVKPAKK